VSAATDSGTGITIAGDAAAPHDPPDDPTFTVEVDPDFARRADSLIAGQVDPSRLADYLVLAAVRNPELAAALAQARAAAERPARVASLPDPRLELAYMIREVETRVGPQRGRIGISQAVPWFGTLGLRGEAASAEAKAALERYVAVKLGLFVRVEDAYADYYLLGREVEITRRNLELLGDLEEVARIRYRTASAKHGDVIKAQVELGRLGERLAALEDRRRPLVARLNALIDRAPAAPLAWPETIDTDTLRVDEAELRARVLARNPELRALDHEITAGEKRLALAGKAFYPDLMLGLGVTITGQALDPSIPDSGKDPIVASMAIDLPIWWGAYRAGKREAQAGLAASEARRSGRARRLETELEQTLYAYRDAERKIGLYRDTLVPKGRQSLEASETAFTAGSGDFLDVIDAQRVLLEFELSYERALAARARRLAELEMLAGGSASLEEVP
jgi:outer membrane protein TolC